MNKNLNKYKYLYQTAFSFSLIIFHWCPKHNIIHTGYPTALNGCWGIVFTHGVRMVGRAGVRAVGNSLSGLYLRNRKV